MKNEFLLWFGSWTSRLGNIIFDYANSISIVTAFTQNPKILALYQSAETLVQIVFNLVGGAKADKGNRKRIVILTDFIAAIICFTLSFVVESRYMAVVMVIANALLAMVYAFNSPTYKAMIRETIHKERIGFFNAVANAGSQTIAVIGPVIGVAIVGVVGARGALIFDAVTFLISAIAECCLAVIAKTDDHAPLSDKEKSPSKSTIFGEIKEGFIYIKREKQILQLVVLSSLVNFFLAGYNLLLPYTEKMFLNMGEGFYGKALVVSSIGGIAGALLCAKFASKISNKMRVLILFLGLTGLSLILVPVAALTNDIIICLIPFALFSASLSAFNIRFMSYVQISVDENYLGRVFSIIFTVAVLFMPIGSFVFSAVLNPENVVGFAVVGGGIVGLTLWGSLHLLNKKKTI